MKFDELGLLVMEQSDYPGNVGDSCAEHCRYLILSDDHKRAELTVKQYRTELGYVRHPLSPWRENDFSSDQLLPLMAVYESQLYTTQYYYELLDRLQAAGYRTGNSNLVTPLILSIYGRDIVNRLLNKTPVWLYDIPLLLQALVMKLPFRWSDSKRWFEASSNSSADYLNFTCLLYFINKSGSGDSWVTRLVKRLIDKETVIGKVQSYYQPEPNSSWIIKLYTLALEEIY